MLFYERYTSRKPVAGVVQTGSTTRTIKTSTDHSGENWGFVRIYEGAHAGVVAQIIDIQPDSITVSNYIYMVDMPNYYRYMENEHLPVIENWIPIFGDKYVLCEGSKIWKYEAPAIITVKEILDNVGFVTLNTTTIPAKINADINFLVNNHTGLTIKYLPCLYIQNTFLDIDGYLFSRAFAPNAVNMQPLAGKKYIPRQFAPLTNISQDIFETEINSVLGLSIAFVEDWDMYHAHGGNVHCGSVVKRLPIENWWEKQPKK